MDTPSLIFFPVFTAIAGYLLFRFVKFGRIKAAMFGARIERTVGEAAESGGKIMKSTVRVHVLDGGPDKAVGLEFVAQSFASYQMLPLALSESETRNLIRFLENAVVEAGDRGT
jgi:hypothetical protein